MYIRYVTRQGTIIASDDCALFACYVLFAVGCSRNHISDKAVHLLLLLMKTRKEKKRKDNFSVMRSQVLYWAAQVSYNHSCPQPCMAADDQSPKGVLT